MRSKTITVSAPGKIHLIGEHTSVYGRPAILAGIDKRCAVTLTPQRGNNVTIVSKNYDTAKTLSFDEVVEKVKVARETWNEFIKTKNISLLTSLTSDVLDYPFLAIGQSLSPVIASGAKQSDIKRLPHRSTPRNYKALRGFTLEIDSDIPVGSGCGSSSAIAVTITGIIRCFLGKTLDKDEILKTAIAIEEFKHGTPSGGDPAAVLYGGLVWYQRKEDEKVIKPLPVTLSDRIAKQFSLIDTGKPSESTGEMIALVREFIEKNTKEGKKIFDDQEKLTHELVDAIEKDDSALMIRIIKAGEENLEKLGVVSAFVKDLIREIETAGGAAKISGGGGKTKGTGMVLAFSENQNVVEEICKKMNFKVYQTKLGEEGLREGK